MLLRLAAVSKRYRFETFGQRSGIDALIPIGIWTTVWRWHDGHIEAGKIAAPAVAQAKKVGIASLRYAVVSAESSRSVMNASD